MTSHVVVALFLLLTALLVAANVLSLGLVFVLAFLAAVGSALGEPVRLALIPALVPRGATPERQCAERPGHRSRGWGRDSPGGSQSSFGWGIEAPS